MTLYLGVTYHNVMTSRGRHEGGLASRYRDHVLTQPVALRSVLERFREGSVFQDWDARWRERGRPLVVLTGMGASLFAAEVAAVSLARAGVFARAIATSDLLDYELAALPSQRFLVVVSQSGESAELAGLLERVETDELHVITNRPDSTLAKHCRKTAVLGVAQDESVALSTYTGSLAALLLLSAGFADARRGVVAARLRAAADEIERRVPGWDAQALGLAGRLANVRSVSFIGWGWGIGSARESALLFKEGARTFSEAMSAAMFRHGAVEVVDERHAVVLFMNDRGDPRREDAWAYVAELLDLPGQVFVIGPDMPRDLAGQGLVEIPAGDGTEASVLTEIVPVQLLAGHLAREVGFQAGIFRNTTPVVSRTPIRSGA